MMLTLLLLLMMMMTMTEISEDRKDYTNFRRRRRDSHQVDRAADSAHVSVAATAFCLQSQRSPATLQLQTQDLVPSGCSADSTSSSFSSSS